MLETLALYNALENWYRSKEAGGEGSNPFIPITIKGLQSIQDKGFSFLGCWSFSNVHCQ